MTQRYLHGFYFFFGFPLGFLLLFFFAKEIATTRVIMSMAAPPAPIAIAVARFSFGSLLISLSMINSIQLSPPVSISQLRVVRL